MHSKFELQIIYFHPCFQYTSYVSKLTFPNDHISTLENKHYVFLSQVSVSSGWYQYWNIADIRLLTIWWIRQFMNRLDWSSLVNCNGICKFFFVKSDLRNRFLEWRYSRIEVSASSMDVFLALICASSFQAVESLSWCIDWKSAIVKNTFAAMIQSLWWTRWFPITRIAFN